MATIRKHRGKHQVQIRRKGFPTISRSFKHFAGAKEWVPHMMRPSEILACCRVDDANEPTP